MLERLIYPVFTFVERIEFCHPFDLDLVLLRNVNPLITSLLFVSFRVIAPDILSTKLNARLKCGWPDKRDQRLNVDDSSKVRKSVSFEVSKFVFGSGLKFDITEIRAGVSKLLRSVARIMKDQSLSSRVTEDNRNPSFLAFVRLNLVKHLAITFRIETQDSPIVD
jgi:hypothetical protein